MIAALLYNLGAFLVIFIAWPWRLWDKYSDGPGIAFVIGGVCMCIGWLIEGLWT